MRRLPRLLVLLLASTALGLASCGGPTGVEVRIDTPPNWKPGVDFNGIRVEATPDADPTQTTGDTYPITNLSPTPYIVYVYADGKQVHHTLNLEVQLWMNGAIKKSKPITNIVLKQGTVLYEVADLSQI